MGEFYLGLKWTLQNMKFLVLLLTVALVAAEESHDVKKRSPDDVYLFFPRGGNIRGITQGRRNPVSQFNFRRPFGGYFFDADDLFDDRRKRQTKPSDAAAQRQKRAADFDDDDYLWYRRPLTTVTYSAPRTSVPTFVRSPAVVPVQRYYYSFDDDHFDDHFDDRKKRSADLDEHFDDRKKRSADPDDDDYHYVYTAPLTTYSVPVATQPRTTQAVAYAPVRYYYDFDFDDKK